MTEPKRYEFVVEKAINGQYVATLGDYDEGAKYALADSPAEAIIDWIEMNGDMLND